MQSAHEAVGAAGTRRSPRPRKGGRFYAQLGRFASRDLYACLEIVIASGAIAVGTLIAERPPHRTVRAAFPHTAPTLGNGGSTTRSSPAIGAPTPALCPTRV